MNITNKIIITDTNIITDLYNAGVLSEFINLDNVYISDLVMSLEINSKSGNIALIKNMKQIPASSSQLLKINKLSTMEKKLSMCDLTGFILAKDHNGILATGDLRLYKYATQNNVETMRTLKIIQLLWENDIISTKKALKAYSLLLNNPHTRIPKDEIREKINELTTFISW